MELMRRLRDKKPKYVFFSGGKDSLAVLLLAVEHWPRSTFEAVYTEVPGNTHPDNVRYVYEVCRELGVRLHHMKNLYYGDFFACMRRWGLPWACSRWCYRVFKKAMWEALPWGWKVAGLKRSDSSFRYRRYKAEVMREWHTDSYMVLPILSWTDEQVLDLIKSYGFDLCPCYHKYLDSGNCMFCSFKNKAQIARVMADDEWRDRIVDALLEVRQLDNKGWYVVRRWLEASQPQLVEWMEVLDVEGGRA